MSEDNPWHEAMVRQLENGFPWRAEVDVGRWYLYSAGGACLARFNLDSGHASRLAAAAPTLLLACRDAITRLSGEPLTPMETAALVADLVVAVEAANARKL